MPISYRIFFDTPRNLSRVTFQLEDIVHVNFDMSATVSFQWDMSCYF